MFKFFSFSFLTNLHTSACPAYDLTIFGKLCDQNFEIPLIQELIYQILYVVESYHKLMLIKFDAYHFTGGAALLLFP